MMPTLALAMCGAIAFGQAAPTLSEEVVKIERERIEAIARASRPTIAVFGNGGEGGGSGVVVTSDGYALTNFHVSSPFGTRMRCSMNDGKIYDAVIVGVDPTGDLALLKLLGRDDFPVATLANSDDVQVGDWCFAIGNPFLLATNLQPTVSYGIVSGVRRYQYPAGTILEYADCIQTDAAINPGNSGGPLFNAKGELIGINGRASFEKRGRVNVGVGYAISINQAKNFLGYLRSGRFADHATLGATVATDDQGRVKVTNILSSSDAYRRGLRYNDELIELAGRPVRSTNEFKNILATLPRDWRVTLRYRGKAGETTTLVRLTGVHTAEELIAISKGGVPGSPPPQPPQEKNPIPDDPNHPKEEGKPEDAPPADAKGKTDADSERDAAIDKLIEVREGFSNYYFNRLERDRVWKRYLQGAALPIDSPVWKLTGKVAGEPTSVEIQLSVDQYSITVDTLEQKVDPKRPLASVIQRGGRPGLALALGLWQRLAQQGLDQAGVSMYMGTMPLLGRAPLRDVISSQLGEVTVRAYFHPETGKLEGMEVFGDDSDDPVEVYFANYHIVGNQELPAQIQLQYGTEVSFAVDLESLEGVAVPPPPKPEVGT